MSRRRQLSDEERALWSGFTRSIRPLHHPKEPAKESLKSSVSGDGSVFKVAPARVTPQREIAPSPKMPPLAPLDRRLKQRVARGRESIDGRIDLHGMTQTQAHSTLLRFLRHAQTQGDRLVLVVTGKGVGKKTNERGYYDSSERGVLKRQVPMWLSMPEFRPFVVGFEDAHANHGGQGALYVRVRRM